MVMELLKGNPNKEHRDFRRRLVASFLGSKRLVKGCGIFPEVVVVPTFGGNQAVPMCLVPLLRPHNWQLISILNFE